MISKLHLYVLWANYGDGSGEPTILGVFNTQEEAEILETIIKQTQPCMSQIGIAEAPWLK